MDAIIAHFQEWYIAYIVGAIIALPIIYVTRRYSVGIIMFSIESFIYFMLVHFFIGTIVRVAAWFKANSSMAVVKDRAGEYVDWVTPWIEFWDKEQYNPQWLIYLEAFIAAGIVYLVLKYRPLRVHNPHKARFDAAGKPIVKGQKKGRYQYQYKRPGTTRK
jgi:hypothetical protein